MDNFFPEVLISYLMVFRQAFYRPGWPYFKGFIWGLLILQGRKCVTNIARGCFFIDRSLSSWERFLSEAKWDTHQVFVSLLGLLKAELGQALVHAGRHILLLDTTLVAKAAGRMAGVQKWHSHSENPDRGERITGHHWAIGGLLAWLDERWHCFPVLVRQISGKLNPSHFVVSPSGEVWPMSFWEAVVALVFQVAGQLTGMPLCVVADAYFAKAPFFNPLLERGITLLTRLRHDAVGWDDPVYCGRGRPPKRGKKWKLVDLFKQRPHQMITVHLYGKSVEVAVVVRDLWLRDVAKKVRVVVVQGVTRPILLACTDLELEAKYILEWYAARAKIELAIRQIKGQLGFADYQATTPSAFFRFVQLCCVAFCLGQLLLRPKVAASWLVDSPSTPRKETDYSFNRLRRGLRRFVLDRFLFSKSAPQTDLQKEHKDFEPLFRLIA